MANTSAVNHEPFTYRELHENGLPPINLRREQWEGNYKEAAIFLEVRKLLSWSLLEATSTKKFGLKRQI